MKRRYSISTARQNLPALVHQVEDGAPVELTRRGRTVAVLLSQREFETLQPRAEDLWSAIERFRAEADLEALKPDGAWDGIRDRSPGRPIEL